VSGRIRARCQGIERHEHGIVRVRASVRVGVGVRARVRIS
jgi:hypothetical protein